MLRKYPIREIMLLVCFFLNGCHRFNNYVPKLRPIVKISGQLYSVPELNLSASDLIEVPDEHFSAFSVLILPSSPCLQEIKNKIEYHIADIFVEHEDGSKTKLYIRWTGHNPAAVSLDDQVYFYGGKDEMPDGATRIVHLLREYERNAKALESKIDVR